MLQPRLTAVQAMHSLTLRLEYETGEVKLFDVAPYATGSWYGQLKDQSYFSDRKAPAEWSWYRMARGSGHCSA